MALEEATSLGASFWTTSAAAFAAFLPLRMASWLGTVCLRALSAIGLVASLAVVAAMSAITVPMMMAMFLVAGIAAAFVSGSQKKKKPGSDRAVSRPIT